MASDSASPLDLVIFDCDGVLVDSERIVNAVDAEMLPQIDLPFSAEEARARFKGMTTEGVVDAITALRGGEPPPAMWLHDWGFAIASALALQLREIPGVRNVIEQLIDAGTTICVASQSPPARVALSLQITDLARYFGSSVYTASMVERPKPAPDLFLHAARRSRPQGAEPARCVVIEDSPSGVRAGVAAGMTVLGYCADEDPHALQAAGAAAVLRDMQQICRWLGDPRLKPLRST